MLCCDHTRSSYNPHTSSIFHTSVLPAPLYCVDILSILRHICILHYRRIRATIFSQRQKPPSAGTDDGFEQNQRFAQRTCMHGYDIIISPLCQFPLGKGFNIWLFPMQPSSQPGSARADDVNADGVTAGMVPGDAASFSTGTPAATTMLPAVGRHITRFPSIRVVPTPWPTVRFSAYPATRRPLLTADANKTGAGSSRSTLYQEAPICLTH